MTARPAVRSVAVLGAAVVALAGCGRGGAAEGPGGPPPSVPPLAIRCVPAAEPGALPTLRYELRGAALTRESGIRSADWLALHGTVKSFTVRTGADTEREVRSAQFLLRGADGKTSVVDLAVGGDGRLSWWRDGRQIALNCSEGPESRCVIGADWFDGVESATTDPADPSRCYPEVEISGGP